MIKLLCVFLVFDCVTTAQRISKLKCDEYESASIISHPRSIGPYLMEICDIKSEEDIRNIGFGTLISEDFILVSIYFNFRIEESPLNGPLSRYRVNKAKVFGEQYSMEQMFDIKRIIPFAESVNGSSDIALIQLNETISYHDGRSIFRPMCLWTESILPTSNFTIYGHRTSFKNGMDDYLTLKVAIPGTIMDDKTCAGLLKKYPLNSVNNSMCLSNIWMDYTTFNSPIHAKIGIDFRDRNYVIGTIFNTPTLSHLAKKLTSYIPWIESTVWPEYKDEETQLGCGQRKIKHKPLITHGFPTYHGEYPWHVALHRLDGGRRKCLNYICGGTIISSKVVVTAAHCLHNEYGVLPANRLIIVAGIHDLNQYTVDTQNYLVQTIVVHNGYNREYLENDIALIKLISRIKFSNYIQPICFGNISRYINMTLGVVVGWGQNELNQPSDVLLQATLPLRSNGECRESNRPFFHTFLNDNNFCAGYDNGTNVCSGDSGGGMIFEYKLQFYIRGIVSLGVALPNSGNCDVTQMILLTDIPKMFDWIKENIE